MGNFDAILPVNWLILFGFSCTIKPSLKKSKRGLIGVCGLFLLGFYCNAGNAMIQNGSV